MLFRSAIRRLAEPNHLCSKPRAVCAVNGTVGCVSRLDRIASDPAVCHGQPTVRGLRYPVETLLDLLAAGMSIDEVLADYPDLERDDVLAALEFGAVVAGRYRVVPLGAA